MGISSSGSPITTCQSNIEDNYILGHLAYFEESRKASLRKWHLRSHLKIEEDRSQVVVRVLETEDLHVHRPGAGRDTRRPGSRI